MFNEKFYTQGRLGELMVVQDIIKHGYVAFEAGPQLAYDVVADVDGRLLRVQVKSVAKPRSRSSPPNGRDIYTNEPYFFRTRHNKGSHRNSPGYTIDSFDLFALVALDIGAVAYMPVAEGLKTARITMQRPDYVGDGRQKSSRRMADFTLARALEQIA